MMHHVCTVLFVSERDLSATKQKEGNALFNDALNTFYLRLYGVGHMIKDHSDSMREETHCHHMGITARVLLYAPSHRQDSTYHSFCYTSRGTLAGTRNSSMGPPHEGSIRRPITHHEQTFLPQSYISLLATKQCMQRKHTKFICKHKISHFRIRNVKH